MRSLIIALFVALPLAAWGGPQVNNLATTQVGAFVEVMAATPINAVCDADPTTVLTASLTCAAFELDLRGFTKVWLRFVYVWSTASAIQIFQDDTIDADNNKVGDTPWAIFQRPTPATGGQVDLDNEFANKPVTASTAFTVEYDVNGPFIRWRFESTGGAVGDTLQVFITKRGP